MAKIPASERDAFYEKRRSELAEVALALMAEKGVEQTSVASIAAKAGLSKGSFYLYFASKDALIEDVFRRHSLGPLIGELAQDLESKGLEEAVSGFVRAAWRHLQENRDLVLLALREAPSQLQRAQDLIQRVVVPTNRVLASFLEEHLGSARSQELSMIISSRALIGMILTIFLTQDVLGAGEHVPVPEDEITQTITELFLRGVTGSAPQGATT